MKRFTILAAMLMVSIIAAVAGVVYDRVQLTAARATGAISWTNTVPYAAIELKNITILNSYLAVDTITVQRVTGDTVSHTSTVCTITNAAYTGNWEGGLHWVYMKYGDKLVYSSAQSTGYYANVEYEVQKH